MMLSLERDDRGGSRELAVGKGGRREEEDVNIWIVRVDAAQTSP